MNLNLRIFLSAILAFILLVTLFSFRHEIDLRPVGNHTNPTSNNPSIDTQTAQQQSCPFALSSFDLKQELTRRTYARGVIRPIFVKEPQPSLSHIEGPFLEDFGTIEPELLGSHLNAKDDCANTRVATVKVAYDPPDTTRKLLIGMTTPLSRLNDRLNEISYYLLSSNASLLVVVPKGKENLEKEQKRYREKGLDITLKSSYVEPFQLRYFSIWREMRKHIVSSRPDTEWVATVDDDTFFPQLSYLTARLSTLDPNDYHWIGTLSESSLNVKNFGYFSYGGSGIYLSRALLDRIDVDFRECTGHDIGPPNFGGDHRTAKCIKKLEPDLNLTVWNELRQWDLRGSPAGLFESGKPIWTYHHWGHTGWFDKDVLSFCATRSIAGSASILQRFKFDSLFPSDNDNDSSNNSKTENDETTSPSSHSYYILTNGFSLVKYTHTPTSPTINFTETEYTWADVPADYEDFVGPFRPVTVEGVTKRRWLLDSARRIGENVHQLYRYDGMGEPEEERGEINDYVEIVWLGGQAD